MRDRDLYTQILGIRAPWRVTEVELDPKAEEVRVLVEPDPAASFACPSCGTVCAGYDRRRRQWRHLDTCQFRTVLVAELPRVQCPTHGVVTVAVPWAEPGSGFTALFEALVIDWLKETTVAAVARQLGLSWNAIAGIQRRAVARGLGRRESRAASDLCIDETAFARRHEYVTVVSDPVEDRVLHVADDRKRESLEGYYRSLSEAQKAAIASVAMDMWGPYIQATLAQVPGAQAKIAFDKFHVARSLGEAVDKVRRHEHRELLAAGRSDLKGSKYDWQRRPENMTREQRQRFALLKTSTLKTARAWAIKEFGMRLWHYVSRTGAEKGWRRLIGWAQRSRLEPMKKVAGTLKEHLWGILNAVVLKVTNGPAEGMNSRIQLIKARSRGFRNRANFRNAIYFHLGGLDLYPNAIYEAPSD